MTYFLRLDWKKFRTWKTSGSKWTEERKSRCIGFGCRANTGNPINHLNVPPLMVHFFDCFFFKCIYLLLKKNHYINNKGTDNKHLKHIMSLIIVLFLSKTPNLKTPSFIRSKICQFNNRRSNLKLLPVQEKSLNWRQQKNDINYSSKSVFKCDVTTCNAIILNACYKLYSCTVLHMLLNGHWGKYCHG